MHRLQQQVSLENWDIRVSLSLGNVKTGELPWTGSVSELSAASWLLTDDIIGWWAEDIRVADQFTIGLQLETAVVALWANRQTTNLLCSAASPS